MYWERNVVVSCNNVLCLLKDLRSARHEWFLETAETVHEVILIKGWANSGDVEMQVVSVVGLSWERWTQKSFWTPAVQIRENFLVLFLTLLWESCIWFCTLRPKMLALNYLLCHPLRKSDMVLLSFTGRIYWELCLWLEAGITCGWASVRAEG